MSPMFTGVSMTWPGTDGVTSEDSSATNVPVARTIVGTAFSMASAVATVTVAGSTIWDAGAPASTPPQAGKVTIAASTRG